MKKQNFVIMCIAVMFVLAACSTSTTTSGDSVETGQVLFRKTVLGSAAGCATCHSVEPGTVLIGPSLAGIGSQAGDRVEGLTAEAYLRQSIVEPNAYLTTGFPAKVMPNTYQQNLSPDEIDSLVTYLLSLK